MNKFCVGLLLLTTFSLTASQRIARHYNDEVERGDKFIDDFVRDMMHEHGHEYEPYLLEDSSIGFSKKIMLVNISGEAKLLNGYINGLRTLHRADECTVVEKDGRLHVSADLGAGVLNCHYDGTVKFMNWGPTISIYGEVKYLETYMEFSTDAKTGRDGVLEKFEIYDLKGMSVQIKGLGPLNWAANYLISGVTSIFHGFIKRMIEGQVRSHVEERLPNYPFPVDGSDNDSSETVVPETENPETSVPEIVEASEEAFAFVKKSIPTRY